MLRLIARSVVVALAAVLTATLSGLPVTQAEAAPTTALTLVNPSPVTAVKSWPATDGVGLSWEPAGVGSYAVDRRSSAEGWLRIADRVNVSHYADTSAPAGLASAYRITPVGVDGEFPGGASESAPVTPLASWQPPAGATTYGSVDGIGIVDASKMYFGRDEAAVWRQLYTRPGVSIHHDGQGWRTGSFAVGPSAAVWAGWTGTDGGSTAVTGTLTVTRAVLRADGAPAEFAAVLAGTRLEGSRTVPVRAIVVLSTLATGLPAYVVADPSSIKMPVPVGSDQTVRVALRNVGGTPGAVSTASVASAYVSPPAFPAWSTSAICLNVQVPPTGQCSTTLRVQYETAANGVGFPNATATWSGAGGLLTTVKLTGQWPSSYDQPTLSMTAPSLVRNAATVTLDASDPQAGEPLELHCRLDTGAFWPCTSTWTLAALSNGRHTLTAYVTDQAGHMSTWHKAVITADSIGPVTSMASPTALVSLGTPLLVSWRSTDAGSGVKAVQARRRTATPTTTYSAYAVPGCCTASLSNGVSITPAEGLEQCWSARGVDVFNQWGTWSAERCFLTPLDDRRLASRGFVRESSFTYKDWKSTARTAGATLTLASVRTRQVGLLVETCRTCGSLDVYVGSTRLGRAYTHSSIARTQVVVWLPHQSVERRGTLTLRSASSQRVVVDGVLVRHR